MAKVMWELGLTQRQTDRLLEMKTEIQNSTSTLVSIDFQQSEKFTGEVFLLLLLFNK